MSFLQSTSDIVQFPSFDYLLGIQIDAHLKQVKVTVLVDACVWKGMKGSRYVCKVPPLTCYVISCEEFLHTFNMKIYTHKTRLEVKNYYVVVV